MKVKTKNIIGWSLAVFLGLVFAMSGATKLMGQEMHLQNFESWGFSFVFMYIIGALEVLGGLGLFIKRFRVLAGLGLAGLMIGGIGTHLVSNEASMIIGPLVLTILALTFAWLRKDEQFGNKLKPAHN
jgi:uncharacterized membrane protein YphA (DoxX/SURF4 family)